jgi:copper chaperone
LQNKIFQRCKKLPMEKIILKTTLNCGGCITKVSPFMNELEGVASWKVDTNVADKLMTVEADDDISPSVIIEAIEQAGFKAEVVG